MNNQRIDQPENDKPEPPLKRRFLGYLKHVGRAVGYTGIVVVSLLTFPTAIPLMIAVWFLWHTVLAYLEKPGWAPLFACGSIILFKRAFWPPGLYVLVATLSLVGLLSVYRTRTNNPALNKKIAYAGIGVLWCSLIYMAIEWDMSARCNHPVTLNPEKHIVCLGDSVTSLGMTLGGYPERLNELVSVHVANHGKPGLTSKNALHYLPRIVEANPQVVVLELGGNDFLNGSNRETVKRNLETFITKFRSAGIEVILVEIPRGFMTDPFAGLERELAYQYDLELVPDTAMRKLVIWSPFAPPGMWTDGPYLSTDGIHPTEQGNEVLAKYVADALVRMYGDTVTRR